MPVVPNRKVVFFLYNFNKGGAEWVITNLCNEMERSGVDVTLLSVKGGNMLSELSPGIKTESYNGKFLKAMLALITRLRKDRTDVLFTTQRGATVFAYLALACSFTKARHIVREAASNFNSVFAGKNILSKLAWKMLYKRAYGKADKLIVNSVQTKLDLINAGIIKATKTNSYHIPNPVNTALIRKRALIASDAAISFGSRNIVCVGRLIAMKQVDIVIRAFAKASGLPASTKLIIIGDGPESSRLKTLAKQLSVADHVVFTGKLDNPYAIMAKCDLLVLASRWEGFGMVVAEALCLGVPVVATDTNGGPTEILDKGVYGALVPWDSEEALTLAITEALTKEQEKTRLVKRAEEYDHVRITERYLQAIFNDMQP